MKAYKMNIRLTSLNFGSKQKMTYGISQCFPTHLLKNIFICFLFSLIYKKISPNLLQMLVHREHTHNKSGYRWPSIILIKTTILIDFWTNVKWSWKPARASAHHWEFPLAFGDNPVSAMNRTSNGNNVH